MVKQMPLNEAQRNGVASRRWKPHVWPPRSTRRWLLRSPRLQRVDRVRAVHRRGLHERAYAGRSTRRTPSELLYDGTTPESKIVGLSYLVWHPGGTPPPGFAGPNDHWHQHNANGGLCLKGGSSSEARPTHRRSARRPAGTRRCCSTCGCCTRGSYPATTATGASSAASARSSAVVSAATCGSRPRRRHATSKAAASG